MLISLSFDIVPLVTDHIKEPAVGSSYANNPELNGVTSLILPFTVKRVPGALVLIPTFPLPVTNNMLEEVGDSTRSSEAFDAPDTWRDADGRIVPIPIFPSL